MCCAYHGVQLKTTENREVSSCWHGAKPFPAITDIISRSNVVQVRDVQSRTTTPELGISTLLTFTGRVNIFLLDGSGDGMRKTTRQHFFNRADYRALTWSLHTLCLSEQTAIPPFPLPLNLFLFNYCDVTFLDSVWKTRMHFWPKTILHYLFLSHKPSRKVVNLHPYKYIYILSYLCKHYLIETTVFIFCLEESAWSFHTYLSLHSRRFRRRR